MTNPATHALEGGCHCGLLRYRLESAPLFVHCCHCRWCQRETGAAFAHSAMIESCRITVLRGFYQLVRTPSASGKGQYIARCPSCRIALWSHYGSLGPVLSFVRVGTLDDPDTLPPGVHIFTASKQPWVVLPPETPIEDGFYERERYWPEASLARRQTLLPEIETWQAAQARGETLVPAIPGVISAGSIQGVTSPQAQPSEPPKSAPASLPPQTCSFCGNTYPDAHAKLVAGPGVFICADCIRLAEQALALRTQSSGNT